MSNPNIIQITTRVEQIIQLEAEAERASDAHRWEAAKLISEELASGKSQRKLAEEIGKSKGHVQRMELCHGYLRVHSDCRLNFTQVYKSPEVRGPRKPKSPTVKFVGLKSVKLEMTEQEFKIFQRVINPACTENEEKNAAVMFFQSYKKRQSSVKEIVKIF